MESKPMAMPVRSEPADIAVPASVANLGPGLDTLAVALELYLHVRARTLPGGGRNELRFNFVGCELDGQNFIERAFRFMAVRDGIDFPSLSVEVRSEVPSRSGLGSSAAATVAGLRLYDALFGPFATQELLNVASELEGHPDNAAAALLGGLTSSCELEDGSVIALSMPWPEAIRFVVLTPDLGLDTASSRRALPKRLGREEVVFNLQRVALLFQALQSREYSLLREALRDRCHQPFRLLLVPGLEQILELEHPDLLGVCLAGAGPSILALAEKNADAVRELLARTYRPLGIPFTVRTLRAYQNGTCKLQDPLSPAADTPVNVGLNSASEKVLKGPNSC
jgi:homoserine kinase